MGNRLQRISIITEIVGAVAIVISLIFVGIQFIENTKATKSATAASTVATISSWYTKMGNNQQSSSLVLLNESEKSAYKISCSRSATSAFV
ncbi:MAG TPA: hypothetical protein DIV79_09830 [Opitutae bacterium]|nr:hypothetical protein [Opitutaceae bacterium]HCR30302.1 hypothetical protein [Opitutae bacterium]